MLCWRQVAVKMVTQQSLIFRYLANLSPISSIKFSRNQLVEWLESAVLLIQNLRKNNRLKTKIQQV